MHTHTESPLQFPKMKQARIYSNGDNLTGMTIKGNKCRGEAISDRQSCSDNFYPSSTTQDIIAAAVQEGSHIHLYG